MKGPTALGESSTFKVTISGLSPLQLQNVGGGDDKTPQCEITGLHISLSKNTRQATSWASEERGLHSWEDPEPHHEFNTWTSLGTDMGRVHLIPKTDLK